MEEVFLVLLFLVVIFYVIIGLEPKLDRNTETHELILWISNPFNDWKRTAITLWKIKNKY